MGYAPILWIDLSNNIRSFGTITTGTFKTTLRTSIFQSIYEKFLSENCVASLNLLLV